MAIRQYSLDYIHRALKSLPKDISMCELGDQVLKGCNVEDKGYRRAEGNKILAKDYFHSLGISHVSIDIHGNNGSMPIDLQNDIFIEYPLFKESFNILTNCGTSEHIKNQYQCFKNIHNLVCNDGMMLHILPYKGFWKDHPHCYFWYTEKFFNELSEKCNYKIYDIHSGSNCGVDKQVYAILIKHPQSSFITELEFNTIINE